MNKILVINTIIIWSVVLLLVSTVYSKSQFMEPAACLTPSEVEADVLSQAFSIGLSVEVTHVFSESIPPLVKQLVPKNKDVDEIAFYHTNAGPIKNVLVVFFSDHCIQETMVLNEDQYTRIINGLINLRRDRASNGA